ncbi:MAG: cysteine desulfurase family protein [Dehalogenimonas sp.]
MSLIYFDNAASTPIDSRVLESMMPYFCIDYGNPSSIHPMGIRAHNAIENARESLAALLGCQSDEIVFTSGGTEADNLAIIGVANAYADRGHHIITSEIEHHAILETCHHLEKLGWRITYLTVDNKGQVSPQALERAITSDTVLVTIMTANNVVGTLQPISEIGSVCHKHGVVFHTDAVQMIGHLPLDVKKNQLDLLSVSGHKFSGPKGVGALYVSKEISLCPMIFGGGQEEGFRSGTENVPGIVGLGKAAEIARAEMIGDSKRIKDLATKLTNGIISKIPHTTLNGHEVHRLPTNINISFEGVEGEYLCKELAKRGLCVSTGSACSSNTHEAPYVLLSMGVERELANCSIRMSLGKANSESEVESSLEILREVVANIRSYSFV